MERERFSSRIGFILISAGCAIGLGNVWRFPYITGKYGGAAFVLIYLFFLIVMGLPIMVMEFAVGRASQKSIALSFNVLEKKGSKWHLYRYVGIAGNFLLMMFYTTIGGWMLIYFFKMLKGDFVGLDAEGVSQVYANLTTDLPTMLIWMLIIVALGFLVCSMGLQSGGKDQQVYDGGTFPADGSAGSEFQPSAGSFRRFEVLSASGFRKADGLSHF